MYLLTWDDFDAESQMLVIRRSAKTGVRRQVPVPKLAVDALKKHRRQMIATQHRGVHTGLIFPSKMATVRKANSLAKPFDEACREADIDIRVRAQVLRRTFNTLLLRADVDRIVIRSMIGHSSEQMTERYAGVDMVDKDAAISRVFSV